MNERIKELAKQADKIQEGRSPEDSEWCETFAKLIVRECATVGYDASYFECSSNVYDKILGNFGV
jgi:hypothetical protein